MKKAFLVLATVLSFAALANAQPKSVGVRIGWGIDLSYENYVNRGNDFLEFELGLDGSSRRWGDGFHLDGIYNFMIAQPDWTSVGNWAFYGGPGASVAVWDGEKDDNIVYAGILGNLGLEYTFDFPLSLSLDVRPRIMFGDGDIRENGIFNFGLGIRYAF